MLMFFQEFSGINCILFYSAYIFEWAGIGINVSVHSTNESALFVSCTLFIFTVISCFLVDRFGRRKLLLFGSVLMSLALIGDGIYSYMFDATNPLKWASKFALFNTLLFIAAFSIGWGPLPWLLMSELFPMKTRGVATAIVTCANWLFVFVTTLSYCFIVAKATQAGAFWIFAGIIVAGFFFVLFFVPETNGRSLEDVSELFLRRRVLRVNYGGSDSILCKGT